MKTLKKGIWPFTPPLGFKRLYSSRRNFILVPDENSSLVIDAFNWRYHEKASYSEISRRLSKVGCLRNSYSVDQILRNPLYTGIMQFDNKKFKANFNPHYKNNRSCTAQKINKSSQHIHRLFRNLIITSNNIEIKKSRQEALKNIHSKLRDIIVMVAHHMKKEISLTRSQIDAIAITEENINPKLKFLEDRLKAAIFQFDAWREFGSLEKFLDFSLLIFSQITFWEILDINAQKEIQKILFPHGVSYDPIKDCILSNNS